MAEGSEVKTGRRKRQSTKEDRSEKGNDVSEGKERKDSRRKRQQNKDERSDKVAEVSEGKEAKSSRRKRGSKGDRHYKQRARHADEMLIASGSSEEEEDDDDDEMLRKMMKKRSRQKGKEKDKTKEKSKEKAKEKEQKRRSNSPMTRNKLPPGVIINTDQNKYEITAVLGAGGFGDVYKVKMLDTQDTTNCVFALKTETSGPNGRQINRLKVEMNILQLCIKLPECEKKHFTKMLDKGRTDTFKFIIMELVGNSIDNIQNKMPHRKFSMSSSINLGIQSLEGIADLHALGYLHRDIKPQNFTAGLGEKAETIMLLDFGIARRFTEKNSKAIRLPREIVRFLGTVRFASRNCHRSREQCRRDDLESWVYMLLEFTDNNGLPWCRTVDRKVVCREKEKIFAGTFTSHIASLPEEIHKVIFYIDELSYQSTPDYEYMSKLLRRGAAKKKVDLNEKFDWVRIRPQESSEDSEHSQGEKNGTKNKGKSSNGDRNKGSVKRKTRGKSGTKHSEEKPDFKRELEMLKKELKRNLKNELKDMKNDE